MEDVIGIWVTAIVIALFGLLAILAYLFRKPSGGEPIPGPPGPPGPTAVSGDSGNQARLGSDSLIFVPGSTSGGGDPERPPDTFNLMDYGGRPWDENFDNADAVDRMLDAASSRGGEFFLPGAFWTSRPLVPQSNSIFRSLRLPRYAWDSSERGAGLIARSNFDGPAMVWNRDMARGVEFNHFGLFGPSEGGDVDGIDYGVSSGPERAWVFKNGTIMYTGVAQTGFMWACQTRGNHIARNGWAIAPHLSNNGQGCRANDCLILQNYIYFNRDGGIWFGGDVESGLTTIAHGRIERSGTSMDPMDPNRNRNEDAPGILLTRATKIDISNITTDCNSGPGVRADAVEQGRVNNLSLSGIFNRDGSHKNQVGQRMPAVVLKGVAHAELNGPMVGFGDPDDAGSGVISPQIGFHLEKTEFVSGHGHVQLQNNAQTAEFGVIDIDNWELTATFSGWT